MVISIGLLRMEPPSPLPRHRGGAGSVRSGPVPALVARPEAKLHNGDMGACRHLDVDLNPSSICRSYGRCNAVLTTQLLKSKPAA